MLGRIHEFVARGQPVPEDLAGPARTLGAEVAANYWSGAAQGGACAEDHTFRARRTGVWQMFPDQVSRLLAEADAVLGEGQRIVIWDVHGECYQPWQVFTSPINAGQPAKGLLENPKLKNLRSLKPEQVDQEIETLAEGQLRELKKRWEGMKKPATEEQLRDEQAHLVDLLKRVRRMTDAEYELNKMALTCEFNRGSKGCDYVDNPDGFGTPEQNGIWPKPDFNDKEVRERWEARLENLLLPELVPFFQTRAALMKQFKPRAPVDLDKISGVGEAERQAR